MKHISVIVPAGNSIVDTIIAPFNMFWMANAYHRKLRGSDKDSYKIDLVGLTREPVMYQGLFSITPTTTIDEVAKTDLIIISPISGDLEKEVMKNKDYVSWIRNQRIENNAELASLCK